MAKYLIIGGGISGLCVARLLKLKGTEFVGLEKEARLGGRAEIGHHRVYADQTVQVLRQFSSLEWTRVDDAPKERRKNQWIEVEPSESATEKFYLEPGFFQPIGAFHSLIEEIACEVKDSFQTKKTIESIFPMEKKVVCQDGSEYTFEKLIWCTDLDLLRKVWKGDNLQLLKSLKKTTEHHGGINLDIDVTQAPFDFKNSVVFSFRYKDFKLRAIGSIDSYANLDSSEKRVHWILFLDEELREDREEVAKCVRALKRELQKEFPELKETIKRERIVYLPSISCEGQREVKTLELVPDVFYVGPQAFVKDSQPNLYNIDRTIDNYLQFEKAL